MSVSGLRERDLRILAGVVEDGMSDDPGPAMPWAVLDQLLELVPCEGISFNELDVRGRQPIVLQGVSEGGGRSIESNFPAKDKPPYPEYWPHRESFRPYSHYDRTGDVTSVLRWSDFYTESELKNAPFYAEYVRPMGTIYAVCIPLPTRPGLNRRVLLGRKSGPDFSERDLVILRLLRPHMYEIYMNAERRRRGIAQLSRREREVLELAAQGHSNAEIGRKLFISVATVRKHMEHIFDRTGVRTRTAAAALALPSVRSFPGSWQPESRG